MRKTKRDKRGTKPPVIDNAIGYSEAAERLGISVRTLQRWVSAERIGRVKIGGRVYFTPSILDKFIESCIKG